MLDNRIYTFLELCQKMNYHKTAQALNMTQPAVTQHIKYLENLYSCSLFTYNNRKLSKTKKAIELEKEARSIVSLHKATVEKLSKADKVRLNIGATKTIGEYMVSQMLFKLLRKDNIEVNLIVDNTERLIERLNHFDLDILIMEGYFDKKQFGYETISSHEIIGICSKDHSFANRQVDLEEIFKEHAIIREAGSGTRAVFENFLHEENYSIESFERLSVISNYRIIEDVVKNNIGISFVYDLVAENNQDLATFKIQGHKVEHEFNYVYLEKSKVLENIKGILGQD